jgi:hypothetical protein
MAAMARWGELRRVPVTLYRKRYHPDNEHMKWFGWPVEKRVKAWIVHCAAMLEQAMLVEATEGSWTEIQQWTTGFYAQSR